jgi:hypothetical protein
MYVKNLLIKNVNNVNKLIIVLKIAKKKIDNFIKYFVIKFMGKKIN